MIFCISFNSIHRQNQQAVHEIMGRIQKKEKKTNELVMNQEITNHFPLLSLESI